MKYTIPIQTISAANAREHWTRRARRAKSERRAAYLFACHNKWKLPQVWTLITLTRRWQQGGRKHGAPLDDDNLRASLKGVRDGIAEAYGFDDGPHSGVRWRYAQSPAAEWAVDVEIT